MKKFSSCTAAMEDCISKQYFSVAHLFNDEKPMSMHIHDCYELYFSISGGKQFLIDNHFYSIKPGDIFFINQYESHHLTQIDQEVHERIVLSISPAYLGSVSTATTDLNYCFLPHHNKNHKLSLSPEDQNRFLFFIHKLCSTKGYGEDLIETSAFLELMVFLNHLYHVERDQNVYTEMPAYNQSANQIITYINQNIQDSLSIKELAEHFFMSESYLCRIFKDSTGTTINKYITSKRITIAKAMLSQGYSVSEACEACGFRDYSNFLKAFTKAVGISPKKYAQFTL